MNTHYEPSGNIDLARTAIGILIAMVLIIPVSFLYNAIISVIPILYLAVVAPIGYGLLLGLIVRLVLHFGKFRSRQKGFAVAIFLGLAANYTQWMAYLDFVYVQDVKLYFSSYLATLFGGIGIVDSLRIVGGINEYGTWSLGMSSQTPVNGWLLTVIWILEFAVILIYPLVTIRSRRIQPFSEEQNKFYNQYTLENIFKAFYTPGKAEAALKQNPLDYLKSIDLATNYPGSRVEVFQLPNEAYAFISISRVTVRSGADQKGKETVVPIVDRFRISNADAKQILAEYVNAKDRLTIFSD